MDFDKAENLNTYLPKLSTSPSTQPVRYNADDTTFARKNKVPIDPPNSGPKVLEIMTKQ